MSRLILWLDFYKVGCVVVAPINLVVAVFLNMARTGSCYHCPVFAGELAVSFFLALPITAVTGGFVWIVILAWQNLVSWAKRGAV